MKALEDKILQIIVENTPQTVLNPLAKEVKDISIEFVLFISKVAEHADGTLFIITDGDHRPIEAEELFTEFLEQRYGK